jgi:LysR family hydrogen peroxide-inducible transcriptional activator
MDIRHLRQILAIRDHGSFAKAARALHVAQPVLSKSVARIEDELRLTIFTRTSAGSELTPMGEMIADRAERVMAAVQDLARDAALVAGGDASTIRLGVGTLLRDTLAPRLLLKIVEDHPRLRLEIEFGAANRLLPLVQSRDLDLVLCGPGERGSLAFVEAMHAQLVFVADRAHPLALEGSISLHRLAEFPCAGPNIPGYTASAYLGLPTAADTLDAYTANDFEVLLPLVCAGRATLFAPAFYVRQAIRSGNLVKLDVDWSGSAVFGCYTSRAASLSPILSRITRYAVELGGAIQQEWADLDGQSATSSQPD